MKKIKHKPIITAIALSISPLAYADLTTGLVAYYPFTGNANDVSGNGNNGTVYGATLTADRNGNANSAYSFDGASYIDTGDNVFVGNAFTQSLWINSYSVDTCDSCWHGFIGFQPTSSSIYRSPSIWIYQTTTIEFGFGNGLDWSNAYSIQNALSNNVWTYIAIVYDGCNYSLYVNGTSKFSSAESCEAIPSHTPIKYIGRVDNYFEGLIDDVRIYNRALSASEIEQLYQQNTQQTTTTLASSLNPAALGQNIIFTGKVTAATVPNGNLTFKIDGSTKYTSNLTNGQLTYATNTLTAGAHTIRAEYAGNTTFAASSAQLTQTITSKPDLIVTAVNLTPPQPTVGNTFTATVTVKNQGGGGDGGQLRLWTNQPTAQVCTASGGDKTLAVGSVAAGASKTLTFTGLNPGIKGAKILRAFVDADCTVAETNDTNNQLVKGYMVKDLRADFIVTALTVTPANPKANNLFTVSATVKNQGMAARAAGYLDVWVNKPTAPVCGAADSDAWIDIGTLAAGASKTVTLPMVADTAGTKTTRAYIDSWCETIEANETNNQLIKSYTVQ